MGKHGAKPTPTVFLKLRGSRKLYDRKNEPKINPGLPDMPDWLPEDAKMDWFRLTKKLLDYHLITNIDGEMLARYCLLLVSWRQNVKLWEKAGFAATYAIKTDDGLHVKCLQVSPVMSAINRLEDKLRRIEAEFGLSPSARAGMGSRRTNDDFGDKSRFVSAGA